MSVKVSSVKLFKTSKISSFSLISQSSGGLDHTDGPERDWCWWYWQSQRGSYTATGNCKTGASENVFLFSFLHYRTRSLSYFFLALRRSGLPHCSQYCCRRPTINPFCLQLITNVLKVISLGFNNVKVRIALLYFQINTKS